MGLPKMDLKDKRVLAVLDNNPNALLSEIAKKALISKQVADYRLRKLIEQKTIYSFFTIINLGKLNYSLFRIHIKLKNISSKSYTSFAQTLFNEYPTFWVGFISGSFDVIADIWARNADEFQKVLIKILQDYNDIVYSYEVFPMISLNMFSYGYFSEKSLLKRQVPMFRQEPPETISAQDIKILRMIKGNSRLSYEEMGRKINLTRNAVKYRIQQLEKKGIIKGYHMMVDFKHFKRLSYKILIAYDHAYIKQEKDLFLFLSQHVGILAHVKLLGRWNLDIELQPHDAKELQQFVIELRNRFSLIKDYELIQIIEDYGLDFFPEKIKIS